MVLIAGFGVYSSIVILNLNTMSLEQMLISPQLCGNVGLGQLLSATSRDSDGAWDTFCTGLDAVGAWLLSVAFDFALLTQDT